MSSRSARHDSVFITNRVHSEVIALLSQYARVDVNTSLEPLPREQWLDRAARASALMVFMNDSIDAEILAQLPKLRVIAAALKGFDNFDVDACAAHGVWFTIVPDLLTIPTAELAIGLALTLARKVLVGDRIVRSGGFAGWRPTLYGMGFHGRTAGIVGMGKLGRAVAERLLAFGMRVLYADSAAQRAEGEREGISFATLPELLQHSDFIFVLAPLTPETRHMFDAPALVRMKPGSFLINMGRGSIVNEMAVAGALQSGHLGGYAADVFEMEDWAQADRPNRICPELLAEAGKTVFTPHLGSADDAVRLEIEMRAARNIVDVLSGRRPPDAINEPG